MRLTFNREALAWAVLIFVVEVLIATVWSHHRWLRSFFGDSLAVVWVYFLLKSVIRADQKFLALAAWLTGCMVELGQYLATLNGWHIANPVVRVVLGSVADWLDILAYCCGFFMILGFEWIRNRISTRLAWPS